MSEKSVFITIPNGLVEEKPKKQEKLIILGLDLTLMSKPMQFCLGTCAIFAFYIIYGYMQELMFRLDGFRPFGWYLTLVQFALYSLLASIDVRINGESAPRRVPLKAYSLLAFLTVATMGLSNTSVGYLNYPTQVIFKCCKLIPTLIGGILIQGKRYGYLDVSAVMCMCFGLIMFTLADTTVQPNFSMYGVVLILLALCADGGIGNVQEKTMKKYASSSAEMVLYSYSIGFFMIFGGMLISGQLFTAFRFCLQYPTQTYGYALIFSITGYFGTQFVLLLVKSYGALPAVTVTTCRKAVTIILSFMFFAKPFTFQYVWSGVVVLLGIYLNLYSKNKTLWDSYSSRLLSICSRRRIVSLRSEHIV